MNAPGPVVLDLSRTLARARLLAPGGIDRVERAWFDWVRGACPDARFLITAGHRHALLTAPAAAELLAALDSGAPLPQADLAGAFSRWRSERQRRADSLARRLAEAVEPDLAALIAPVARHSERGATYINVAQSHLDAERLRALRAGGVTRAVAMIHDVIALEHPEFVEPAAPTRLMTFLAAAGLCDGVIFASERTAARAPAFMDARPPACVAPLGVRPLGPDRAPEPELGAGPADFVMLGSVEARKNHLGMLWIWRRLHDELGAAAPHLHVIGRRGAEAGAAFAALERSPAAGRCVFEHQGLDDAAAARRVARARALLLPSFAEGASTPAPEALAMGTPVIAADLPELREACGDAPDYLDPLDLPAWIEAILNYAAPEAPARDAQRARIAAWERPRWETHFDRVAAFLHALPHAAP